MRWALAVVVASIAMYMWGFFYWMASGMPERGLLPVVEAAAAGEALAEHFPEEGVYMVPGYDPSVEGFEELHTTGPLAMVYLTSSDGAPVMDPGVMYAGFCHMLLSCIFLSMLLGLTYGALPTLFYRIRFFIFVGFLCAFYVHAGEAVWWRSPWSWQLVTALYDWTALAIGGAVISMIAPFPTYPKEE